VETSSFRRLNFGKFAPVSHIFVLLSSIFIAYAPVRDAIGAGGPNAPAYMKFLAGAVTGAIGSIAG
jgi:hypothetical protein